MEKNLEEEPATNLSTADEVQQRQMNAKKRKFDPVQYVKIRGQIMGVSCHSNSSRVGAMQNQKKYVRTENHGMRHFKTTKKRLDSFNQME